MDAITLTVGNEPAALPVLRAASTAFLRAAGAEEGLCGRIGLVLDEVFTNILEHGYPPDRRERVQAALGVEDGVLTLTLRFQGIPFDVDALRRCAEAAPEDMLADGGRGLGLRLVRQFMDQVEYRNLGKEGQEIRLVRRIAAGGGEPRPRPTALRDAAPRDAAPFKVGLRDMRPTEAAEVSRLAYLAYGYSHAFEQLYDPAALRELNEAGRTISFVAEREGGGIIGHFAIAPDDHSDLMDLCAGFVDPAFRGQGTMNAMAVHGIDQARRRGAAGVFVTAVLDHVYSQKAALAYGLRETALFVSCAPGFAIRAIREEAAVRETLVFMARFFEATPRGPFHAPAHHRDMLERICRNAGITATFAQGPEAPALPEQGALEQEKDGYQAGHIFVTGCGRDTVARVRRLLRQWRLDRLETVYLYLPLLQPATAALCRDFEAMGFFFSGLRPGRQGRDWLALQFLNNQRYDYGPLQAATDFGRELIEYVRQRDPDQGD